MKIYTSYFGNKRNLDKAGIKIICVAVIKPRYMAVDQILSVAPTRYMISSACSEDEYLRLYNQILSNLNAHDIVAKIESLSGGHDVALCCYEKKKEECHRYILAKWIEKNTGIKVKEYGEEDSLRQYDLPLF